MNVKIHTPKSLKTGSGMATMKQFLLSLVATTISIVLTFGTAAWVDGRKKEEAKREMVMMILYDLAGSIDQVAHVDSLLRAGFEQQVAVARQPQLIEQNPFLFVKYFPIFDYTETVENIFSSNIETINTLGNVVFSESASTLYQLRKVYKEHICDSFRDEFERAQGFKNYDAVVGAAFAEYIQMSSSLLSQMKMGLAECQKMMDVSDDALAAYRQNRFEQSHGNVADSISDALFKEMLTNSQRLDEAKQQGKATK